MFGKPFTRSPTAVPSTVPTVVPTTIITAYPSELPTSAPSVAIGSPVIIFDSTIGYNGVSADAMNNDTLAQATALEATAGSMGHGVVPDMLQFLEATSSNGTDTTGRRFRRNMATASIDVVIMAIIPVSAVGVGDNSTETYTVISNALSTAVASGEYTSSLNAIATTNEDALMNTVTVTSVIDDGFIDSLWTSSPIPTPTHSSSSEKNDSDDLWWLLLLFAVFIVALPLGRYIFHIRGKSVYKYSHQLQLHELRGSMSSGGTSGDSASNNTNNTLDSVDEKRNLLTMM